MPWSEKFIKQIVEKNRKYLDALEAADKLGKRPVFHKKVRKDFTIDEDVFDEFQARCKKRNQSMSRVIEELIKKYALGD